jgi:FkbM family methyltransferase
MPGAASFKLLAKDLLRGLGVELRRLKYVNSEETVLCALLGATAPAAVLDVGANLGQYAALLRKYGYRGRIVSFEALPDVHAKLASISARDPLWTVAPCAALGSRHGQIEINVAGNSVSSSVLPMNSTHSAAAPESVYIGRRSVALRRLDELLPQVLPTRARLYLKIDTQGFEREVLEGSSGLLADVVALQVETSLTPLYTGAPSFTEMVSYVEGLGYEIFSLVPGLRNNATGRLLQMDAFFVRGSTSRDQV